jgi:prefoldin subunit 2
MSVTPEAEGILNQYKGMMAECQSIASKISELKNEKEEHRLVVESLSKLEDERKAFRLIGGVLVEKTVGEVLPVVNQNFSGVSFIFYYYIILYYIILYYIVTLICI